MKKRFKFYLISWSLLLVLFNVLSLIDYGLTDTSKYTPMFWTGYTFVTISLLGNLACAYYTYKSDSLQQAFYYIPLVKINYSTLSVSFVVGTLCMLIYSLPYLVGVIVCLLTLCINIVSVLTILKRVDKLSSIDKKIKQQTFFIKSLAIDAEVLIHKAQTDSIKAECKKVFEAIRYSDPMSNEKLVSIEEQITEAFDCFSKAVATNDIEQVISTSTNVIILVDSRNKKCKLLK